MNDEVLIILEQFPKLYRIVGRKGCRIAFNQISCASLIDCLMEILSHLTNTSTPTMIWRTSCSALHSGLCHSSVKAPLM